MIEALSEYHRYFGDSLRAELPWGSVLPVTLGEVADGLAGRLVRIFLRDEGRGGRRPVFGEGELFQVDPFWCDHVPFYEYFHGEHGAGLGASHQTGWTALVTELFWRTECHSGARHIGSEARRIDLTTPLERPLSDERPGTLSR